MAAPVGVRVSETAPGRPNATLAGLTARPETARPPPRCAGAGSCQTWHFANAASGTPASALFPPERLCGRLPSALAWTEPCLLPPTRKMPERTRNDCAPYLARQMWLMENRHRGCETPPFRFGRVARDTSQSFPNTPSIYPGSGR